MKPRFTERDIQKLLLVLRWLAVLSGGSAVRVRVFFIISTRSSLFSQGAGTRSSIALLTLIDSLVRHY